MSTGSVNKARLVASETENYNSNFVLIFVEPVQKVSDKGLNCIRCHEAGALLAVGDDCGKTYVIQMNDWFVTPGKNDKALLTAVSHQYYFFLFLFFERSGGTPLGT